MSQINRSLLKSNVVCNARQSSTTPRFEAKWAERLVAEHGDSSHDLIQTAYRAAFSRDATPKEIELAEKFMDEESVLALKESADTQGTQKTRKLLASPSHKPSVNSVAAFCHALFNTNEFITVD